MSDLDDTDADLVDDFERLGRQAAAELRRQPPADGPGAVQRSAHRRRATVAAITAGATVAILVAGSIVANSRQDEPAPIATVPPVPVVPTTAPSDHEDATPAPVVPTTALSDNEDATPANAARTTTPGTWRAVPDPSSLSPELPSAAVWTGTDVIVIGGNWTDASELSPPSAAAYDIGQDRFRRLADPPPALGQESLDAGAQLMQWTGSEVLAATNQGEVYSYDPVQDRWESRTSADETMSLPAVDALVAVSPRGVLARSSTGWWWYDNTTDRWESVPAPPNRVDYSVLNTLDQDRIAATQIKGSTITSSVFDIASRNWSIGPPVEDAPVSNRTDSPTTCDANDGLLVCWAEGFGTLFGVVIDPLVGGLATFELGNHASVISVKGLPWMIHASKLLSPRSATWEDLPRGPYSGVDSFTIAAWTGSEIVFFGGDNSARSEPLGLVAAYTPFGSPERDHPDGRPAATSRTESDETRSNDE